MRRLHIRAAVLVAEKWCCDDVWRRERGGLHDDLAAKPQDNLMPWQVLSDLPFNKWPVRAIPTTNSSRAAE